MKKGFLSLIIIFLTTYQICKIKLYAQETPWNYINDNYFLSSVKNTPWGILIGEYDTRAWLYPFNGLYISKDSGETFEQFNLKDKGITDIFLDDNDYIYATTYYHTTTPAGLFKSTNKGISFEHIGPPYSSNIVKIIDNIILLGTYAHGLFVSIDNGNTWEQKIPGIFIKNIEKQSEDIIIYGYKETFKSKINDLDFEKIDYIDNKIEFNINQDINIKVKNDDIYFNDSNTNLNKYSIDTDYYYDGDYHLLSIVNGYGLYKYLIPKNQVTYDNKFDIPFDYNNNNDLLDKITAYFDHEYPLLGTGQIEQEINKNTTLNFLGIKKEPPDLYYSSHNGTDYALKYGEKIYATANGIAKYFWCDSCGHSIRINHQNGYESIYMHLQENVLIDKNNSKNVNKGDHIGYVGLSGNTTGPHLHFSVKKDNKVIDPYGWHSYYTKDPWENYQNGNISGEKSIYLWNHILSFNIVKTEKDNQVIYKSNNVTLKTDKNTQDFDYVPQIYDYIKPSIINQKNLNYVNNTSAIISIYNTLGKKISNINNVVKIEFNIPTELINKNISIWHYDNTNKIWNIIDSKISYEFAKISADVSEFSHFAVFENTYVDLNNFYDKLSLKNSNFTFGYWN